MRKSVLALFTAVVLVFASCEKQELVPATEDLQLKSGNKVLNFRTHLSGMNEVPPYETEASGQAIFQLSKDGEELSYKLIVDDISDVTMAHIHLAPAGQNGSPVVWLYQGAPAGPVEGILAEGIIIEANLAGKTMSELISDIYNGNAYVNVHTLANKSGEIRGQISGNMPMGN